MQLVEIAIIVESFILAGCFYMLTCDLSSFAKAITLIVIITTLIFMAAIIFNHINTPLIALKS